MKKIVDKNFIIENMQVVIGTFIAAFSINVFFLPNGISSGGASGVGIILNYLTGIPVSLVIIVFNLPLFIFSLKKIGLKFSVRTIVGTILLALFVELTLGFSKFSFLNIGSDRVLSSIYGGLLLGLGLSLVFRGNSSTGGSELLAQIIYKYRPAQSMSGLMLLIDSGIILFAIIVFKSVNSGLYSLIAIFVSKKTIDIVFGGINYTKVINIITKKENQISVRILKEISRGATAIKCIGKYTGDEFAKIECVATIPQIARIKRIVKEEDSGAFVYVATANEVLGHGFEKKQ